MKKEKKHHRIALGFTDTEWAIVQDALHHGQGKFLQWICHWAIIAVCFEIIRTKSLPCPLGVTWRQETDAELARRARRIGEGEKIAAALPAGIEHKLQNSFAWRNQL